MKNKNGLYIGAIIVLIIILIGIVVTVIFANFKEEDNDKEIDDSNDVVETNQYNYDEKISKEDKDIAVKFDKLYDKYRLENINVLENKVEDFNTLENKQKLDLVGLYYDYYYDIDGYAGKTFAEEVTSDDFKDFFKTIFKDEITFEDGNLLCTTSEETEYCHVNYNGDTKTYTYDEGSFEHDKTVTNEVYSKLIDAKHEDNIYTLTYIKVYNKSDNESETDFYDNYNFDIEKDKKVVSKPENFDGYNPTEIVDEVMKDVTNYDNYAKYTYTIEVDDDNLYLVGYEFAK